MRQQARSAFLVAPAVLAITLTAAVSACGSAAAPQLVHSAADPGGRSGAAGSGTAGSAAGSAVTNDASGRATGTSTAAVPPPAKRVQCPEVMTPQWRLSGSAEPNGPLQPIGPVWRAQPIPPGFKPVAVVECVTVTSVHNGVARIYERRQAAVAGLSRLMAALREPSHPQPKGTVPACMMPIRSWLWFVLVSASGQVIRPVVPVGICGQPAPRVVAVLKSLHWIPLGIFGLHPMPFRPPLHGGPIHDITPGITQSN